MVNVNYEEYLFLMTNQGKGTVFRSYNQLTFWYRFYFLIRSHDKAAKNTNRHEHNC